MANQNLKPKKGKKELIKTEDATPTWMGMLPMMKACIEEKAQKGMSDTNMWEQIARAFTALDGEIAKQKDNKANNRVTITFDQEEFALTCLVIHSSQNRELIDESVEDGDFDKKYLDIYDKMVEQMPETEYHDGAIIIVEKS